MLYQAYQAHSDIMVPVRSGRARRCAHSVSRWRASPTTRVLRNLTAAYDLIARTRLTHARPPFGIDSVTVGNREVAVHERAALTTPFGTLLHFKKDIDTPQPRVLLVAPLSGHFATLLRGTVRTMLPEHDVYITDWHNVRDVPLERRPVRLRRLYRASDPVSWRRSAQAPTSWRSASLAWPSSSPSAVMAQIRQCSAAAQHDLDGGADRHPRQPDQGERACQFEADRMVRAQPDRDGAVALSRRVPPGLSGLRAARGVHEHERRAPYEGAS